MYHYTDMDRHLSQHLSGINLSVLREVGMLLSPCGLNLLNWPEKIWWSGFSNAGSLWNAEYSFIDWSTLAWNGSTLLGLIYGWNRTKLFIYDIIINRFKLQLHYYIHFQTIFLGKLMNLFISSSYELNSTLNVPLKGWMALNKSQRLICH